MQNQLEDRNQLIDQMASSQQTVFGGDSGLKQLDRLNKLRPIVIKQTRDEQQIKSKNQTLKSQAARLETYAESVERLTIDLKGRVNELAHLMQMIERIEAEK